MTTGLLIGVCCTVLFWRAADYERMNPLIWAMASVALTAVAMTRGMSLGGLLLLQLLLFVGMWAYNIRRHRPGNRT